MNKKGRKTVERELEFSITIGKAHGDLNVSKIKARLQRWLDENCIVGFFGVERGSNLAHLHLQGVIRRTVAGGAVNTKDLKFALFAPLDASKATYKCPRENIVTSTQLTGQKLHTWHGMLGYCQKDKMEAHYQVIKTGNISDEDLSIGCDLYCQYGNGDLKNKSVTSVHTVFERCSTFYKLKMQKFFNRPSIQHVLLRMHKTGRYYPTASWIVPTGGRGMNVDRANAAWLMSVNPAEVKMHHVVSVYFGGGDHNERYFTQDMFDEKSEALVKVEEGLLAGDRVSMYETVHQFDADIQKQLAAEHANGDDALQFDAAMLASPSGDGDAGVLVPKFALMNGSDV